MAPYDGESVFPLFLLALKNARILISVVLCLFVSAEYVSTVGGGV